MAGIPVPRDGDVIVSHRTASIELELAIVPAPPHMVCAKHDDAVEWARRLARERQVDAWLTEDLRHFVCVATHRP